MSAFLGMRGSGDFTVTGQRPENYREKVLELEPNGMSPLMAILSMLSNESTDDSIFHWYDRVLSTKAVTGTAGSFIYEDVLLSNAYDAGDDYAAGTQVHAKMSAANAAEFRVGSTVMMRDASDASNDVSGIVTDVFINGASSRVSIKLLQADGTGTDDLSTCDTILVVGNAYPEGAAIPNSQTWEPTLRTNYCQIFHTSLEMTGTAMATHLRTGDPYKDAKRQALLDHNRDMEMAFLFGYISSGVGSNGKPLLTMDGVLPYLRTNQSSQVFDYRTDSDTDWNGKTWDAGGELWLDSRCEVLSRYGSPERLALCGSGFLKSLQRLAKAGGQIQLTPQTMSYGLSVVTWIAPGMTLHFKTHPLLSQQATTRDMAFILDVKNLKYRYVQGRDTFFRKDTTARAGGTSAIDGIKEEYITECGLEIQHPLTHAVLFGAGSTNTN